MSIENQMIITLINYGIAGVVIYMLYTLLINKFEKLNDKIDKLNDEIERLTNEIIRLRETIRGG